MNTEKVICEGCGTECQSKGGAAGYGTSNGKRYCYQCCAQIDRDEMDKAAQERGRFTLYLVKRNDSWFVENWPGTLSFPARIRWGRHNIAGKRTDAWFTDHAGRPWHGVQIGEWTQLCHCRPVKRLP